MGHFKIGNTKMANFSFLHSIVSYDKHNVLFQGQRITKNNPLTKQN